MKELQSLIAEADFFKDRRRQLAQGLKSVDARFQKTMESMEATHTARLRNIEAERKTSIEQIESRARKEIADYISMKNSLQSYINPVRQWCPSNLIANYIPNPARVNEAELNHLIKMLQEQGLMAWIKRTFKLDGFSSRTEMAIDLLQKIEDAQAFCNERISAIESRAEVERSSQITASHRKSEAEKERYLCARKEEESKQKTEKVQALSAINRFDNSDQLRNVHEKLEHMQASAENFCGQWGNYTIPTGMPSQIPLCAAKVVLPNRNGIDTPIAVPVWVDLYTSNIIVITASSGFLTRADGEEKLVVRKLLARMLKTIPPGNCSYSVFDSLLKGASLGRLIDVTNIGTTDLNFDLFTSDESDSKTVSCAERRKYLRNRPAEIIKYTAGKSKTLFEHNKLSNSFDFPFSWYIDFSFPDDPSSKLIEDLRELLVNAPAAGYSFIFVASPTGYSKINSLAQQYTDSKIIHIDIDRHICEQGDFQVQYLDSGTPSSDQIFNFTTALKKFYDEGGHIDNRISSVFKAHGIELLDASKKLTVPMAIDSRGRLVNLELGGEGSVHGFISGGTNSGKSTLLHTIILSACLHYHPNDLEIWLVDYKQTEFHLYKNKTPPHIKLIGVSKTADFTFSLLDRIEREAARRTELMNNFEVQDLADYRKHENEPGYVNIPRLFIIIDEFHEMSQFVAEDSDYKNKLENILREYRAQGITCLMADQTFSTGLSGLSPSAKNQIGLRIAMRNEASPQEIKDTLEVDRALYSDSMQRTIAIMSQGEFIMKVYVRNSRGELTDIKLEKFKGLLSTGDDILPISKALRALYKGQYKKGLLYVNTKEKVPWSDMEPAALDQVEPLRYPNIRFYLGRSATLRPCFGLDVGRQPNENISIVGGTAHQRWEILASIIQSCRYRNYKLLVFMAEYSDLMSDYCYDIRELCRSVPDAELLETYEDWCSKLDQLSVLVDSRQNKEDIVCVFIGLEIAKIEFSRFPQKSDSRSRGLQSFDDALSAKLAALGMTSDLLDEPEDTTENLFDALPIIDTLFSSGARNGIRCVTEVSVYRQFEAILHLKDMCRHRIAFSMSADDCLMYLGSSSYQKSIENDAVYSDGSKEVKKLLPYRIDN